MLGELVVIQRPERFVGRLGISLVQIAERAVGHQQHQFLAHLAVYFGDHSFALLVANPERPPETVAYLDFGKPQGVRAFGGAGLLGIRRAGRSQRR